MNANGDVKELLPCPFCGRKVQFNIDIDGDVAGIYCNWCKAYVRFTSIDGTKKGDKFGDTMNRYAEKFNRRDGCRKAGVAV